MRVLRFLAIVGILCSSNSILVFAQQDSPRLKPIIGTSKPIRDAKAEAIVEGTVRAMGGTDLIGQIQALTIQATAERTTSKGQMTGTITWEKAGAEFRVQNATTEGTNTIVSGRGRPAISTASTTKALPAHVIRAQFSPAMAGSALLAEIRDPNYSIEYGGQTTLGVATVNVVHTAIRTGFMEALVTPQVWYIDTSSNLPLRVEYRLPSMLGPKVFRTITADFSNFQNVSGALYPFHITVDGPDKTTEVISLQKVSPNSSIPNTDFDSPLGGAQ